jgi:hypothetical protein
MARFFFGKNKPAGFSFRICLFSAIFFLGRITGHPLQVLTRNQSNTSTAGASAGRFLAAVLLNDFWSKLSISTPNAIVFHKNIVALNAEFGFK